MIRRCGNSLDEIIFHNTCRSVISNYGLYTMAYVQTNYIFEEYGMLP
jgi:hypothetical protein